MARACFRRVPPGAPRVGHPCAQPPCRPPPSRPSPRPRSRDASASVHAHRADQRVPLKTRFRAPTLPRPKAAKTPPPGNVPVEAGTWHQVEREGPHWRHVSAHGARHLRSGRETTARPGRGRRRVAQLEGRSAGVPPEQTGTKAALSRPARYGPRHRQTSVGRRDTRAGRPHLPDPGPARGRGAGCGQGPHGPRVRAPRTCQQDCHASRATTFLATARRPPSPAV